MNNAHKLLARYIVCDYVAANIAWMLFIAIRYYLTKDSIYMQDVESLWQYMQFRNVYRGQILFPILMVFIFYLSGYYNTVYFKSRLQEFLTTLFSSFIVAIISYFIILINDNFVERQRNYELIASMWGIIFICVYLPRFLTTRSIMKKIQHGHICFRTLIIGLNQSTVAVKNAIKNSRYSMGYKIVGVIPFDNETPGDEFDLPVFKMSDLDEICRNQNIQNIIIATENRDNKTTLNLINRLFRYDIPIKVAPELYDIIRSIPYNVQPDRGSEASPDYALEVKSSDGNRTAAVLYCMDSNSYSAIDDVGGYAWLNSDQVDWYRSQSGRYTDLNGGQPLPALAFFHIPLPEYNCAASDERAVLRGIRMEKACAPVLNTGMFAAMKESGDVMGVFVGHDHDNDYTVMWHGILLGYGRYTGGDTVYNHLPNGARVIVLEEDSRSFTTWIDLAGGETVSETVFPDSYIKD